MKKNRRREWLKAGWHAFVDMFRGVGAWFAIKRVSSVIWFLATHKPDNSFSTYLKLNRACRRCPIYDKTMRTCGSRAVREALGNSDLGCLCWIPLKAKYGDISNLASCYIDIHAGPENLNGLGWYNAITRRPASSGTTPRS